MFSRLLNSPNPVATGKLTTVSAVQVDCFTVSMFAVFQGHPGLPGLIGYQGPQGPPGRRGNDGLPVWKTGIIFLCLFFHYFIFIHIFVSIHPSTGPSTNPFIHPFIHSSLEWMKNIYSFMYLFIWDGGNQHLKSQMLSHCGLVMPYRNINLCQHWFR